MADVRASSLLNDWVRIVRWARLGGSTTAVALGLAWYAKPDGTDVFPGTARLALDLELSYRTVKYAMKRLRLLGLLERVRRLPGSLVTEYRLTLPPLDELRQHTDVPDPEAYKKLVDNVNKAERRPDWRAVKAGRAGKAVARTSGETCGQPETRTNQRAGNSRHNVRATSARVTTKEPPAMEPPSPPPLKDHPLQAPTRTRATHPPVNDTTTYAGTAAERDRQTTDLDAFQRRLRAIAAGHGNGAFTDPACTCPAHRDCTVCGEPLDPVLAGAGETTHPACDPNTAADELTDDVRAGLRALDEISMPLDAPHPSGIGPCVACGRRHERYGPRGRTHCQDCRSDGVR